MPIIKKVGSTTAATTSNVLSRIKGIEFNEQDGFSINLYGESASGKTTLWGTFPGKILAIICSSAKKPGELRSLNTPAMKAKVKTVRLEKSTELIELCQYLENGAGYATVVLDHASALQEMVLKELLGLDNPPVQLSWGMVSRQQYGQIANQMKTLLRMFLGVPGYRVVVAQERSFGGNDDDEEPTDSDVIQPKMGSALLPSVTGWLNPECDYIIETFKRQKTEMKTFTTAGKSVQRKVAVPGIIEYCARAGPDVNFTTKFRVPKGTKLPQIIVDPSFDKLLPLTQGKGA